MTESDYHEFVHSAFAAKISEADNAVARIRALAARGAWEAAFAVLIHLEETSIRQARCTREAKDAALRANLARRRAVGQ